MTDRNYVLIVAASGDEATAAADFTNYDAAVKALNEGDEKIVDATTHNGSVRGTSPLRGGAPRGRRPTLV